MAKIPRSGFAFLGSGKQNVAEHTNRVCYIGYTLAQLDGTVDVSKVVMMCLFHDFSETRSLDHNYISQKYVKVDEHTIIKDQLEKVPFKEHTMSIIEEYQTRQTLESKYAKEADILELMLFLREEEQIGNKHANERLVVAKARLQTSLGKELGESIMQANYDDRRRGDKNDQRRVNRNRGT